MRTYGGYVVVNTSHKSHLPRKMAPYHTEVLSPTSTEPITEALGAINDFSPTFGLLSKKFCNRLCRDTNLNKKKIIIKIIITSEGVWLELVRTLFFKCVISLHSAAKSVDCLTSLADAAAN
jgi:hypothetical protein